VLGAFVTSANRNIDNPRFRPEFTLRPPAGKLDEVLFDWPADLAVVRVEAKALGHIYVEAERGERILDAHPNESQTLALHLPPVRPLFIRRNDDKAEFVLATTGASTVTELQPIASRISRKGALDLALEQIFASTFGPQDLREFRVRAESLVDSSQPRPRDLSTTKTVLGVTALASAAAGVVLAGLAVREYVAGADAPQSQIDAHNRALVPLRTASVASFAIAGVSAMVWALIPPERKTQVFVGPELGGGTAVLEVGGHF
jgi:hypothetical protein